MKFHIFAFFSLFRVMEGFSIPSSKFNVIVQPKKSVIYTSKLASKKQGFDEPIVLQGVGVEGCSLPSPSGVNTLPESTQALIFFGIFAVLGVATAALSTIVGDATAKLEWFQSWRYTWPLLGAIYAAAGVTHFTIEEEYENIYPQKGSWGIWYLPGSAKFHVRWTGIAELLGGIGLLIGGAFDAFAPSYATSPNVITQAGIGSDSAAGLFILTLAVTPANIYMFSHGARLPKDGPEVPVIGHLIRGIFQVVLLTMLYQMGLGTFDELLNY